MTEMRRLVELPLARLRWLGPADMTPDAALARLRPLLAALGPHHAALLAAPVRTATGIAWDAPGTAHRPMPALDMAQRQVFDRTLTRLLSDVRRAAETARAEGRAEAAALLDLVRRVPAPKLVFAVDGAPVLAGWGMAAGEGPAISVLTPFDDGIGAAPLVADRTAIWLTAIALVLLAVAAILAAPVIKAVILPPLPACVVDERGLTALQELEQLREQGRGLAAERDRLRMERGRRQLDCPLSEPPRQPAPPPPALQPPPEPPPPPRRAELPQEFLDRDELAMLQGCWNLGSDDRPRDVDTGRIDTVRSRRMCLDAGSRGRQRTIDSSGRHCEGLVAGRFEGQALRIDDTAEPPCADRSRALHRVGRRCERAGDDHAECVTRSVPAPGGGGSRVALRR